jgi:uncharacterized membrane protein YfcA
MYVFPILALFAVIAYWRGNTGVAWGIVKFLTISAIVFILIGWYMIKHTGIDTLKGNLLGSVQT